MLVEHEGRSPTGPHAHLNSVEVGDGAFIATGAALFPGAHIGAGAEVRINGVVHVNSPRRTPRARRAATPSSSDDTVVG
jgi:carbonic anhydrase/acetyltransferase-like protein (isoleucine patch superfamily)